MKKQLVLGSIALLLAGAGIAYAQTVDGLDIQAVLKLGDEQAADAQALANEVAKRGEMMRKEAQATVLGGQSNLENAAELMQGQSGGAINFDEIVKTATSGSADLQEAPQLVVFASLSMPEQSLKALIKDTAAAGGTVVFRGFPGNSMKAFQQGIMKVVDNKDDYGNIGIDPRLFRAFDIKSVPAIVVVTSSFDLCDGFDCTSEVPPFDVMTGNVTLGYALETFEQGNGPGAAVAGQALSRLKAKRRRL
jgi:conjugal transfer pilus assembly protein TrbC